MSPVVWGVDSAASANPELLSCVNRQFGSPDFWGRYLTTIQGASEGLTIAEITFLKKSGIKLMPIYNNFRRAVGKRDGSVAATNAIFHARRLRIRTGTVLFANVERFFEVDSQWLIGWVDTTYESGYRPGFYFDPVTGGFNAAYCQASEQNDNIKSQSILWSAEPETGVTSKRNAPRYKPKKPVCAANVWAWQYGRDSPACPVDTVLAEHRLYQLMH